MQRLSSAPRNAACRLWLCSTPAREGERYHVAQFLYNAGIPVYIDHKHAIAHNKIMLIDGRAVLTGSFNFTKAAEEKNAENLLILQDKPDLYAAYEKNFQTHLRHADKYQGRPAQAEQSPSRSSLGPTVPAASRRGHDEWMAMIRFRGSAL